MKLSIFILCIAIPLFSSAQSDTVADLKSNKWSTEKPDYFLVLNDQNIKLDSISLLRINEKWIKKVIFIKDEKFKNTFGNTPVKTILLYPKKRFIKRFERLLIP